MRRKEYACPNGCFLPPRKKNLGNIATGHMDLTFMISHFVLVAVA